MGMLYHVAYPWSGSPLVDSLPCGSNNDLVLNHPSIFLWVEICIWIMNGFVAWMSYI